VICLAALGIGVKGGDRREITHENNNGHVSRHGLENDKKLHLKDEKRNYIQERGLGGRQSELWPTAVADAAMNMRRRGSIN